MSTANITWKEIWRGSGPSWSPTGTPPGLTIVRTKEAWTQLVKPYGPPLEDLANLPVDWEKGALLWLQGHDADPAAELRIKSISTGTSEMTVLAELQPGPPAQPNLGVVARPWLIASIAASDLSNRRNVKFVVSGRTLAVRDER